MELILWMFGQLFLWAAVLIGAALFFAAVTFVGLYIVITLAKIGMKITSLRRSTNSANV
jgi:hypothetical protein